MPELESVSSDGLATLRFNTPMTVPEMDDLTSSRVALRVAKAITSNEVGYESYDTGDGVGEF